MDMSLSLSYTHMKNREMHNGTVKHARSSESVPGSKQQQQQQQQDEAAEDVSRAAQAVMWPQRSDAGLGLVAHCQFFQVAVLTLNPPQLTIAVPVVQHNLWPFHLENSRGYSCGLLAESSVPRCQISVCNWISRFSLFFGGVICYLFFILCKVWDFYFSALQHWHPSNLVSIPVIQGWKTSRTTSVTADKDCRCVQVVLQPSFLGF